MIQLNQTIPTRVLVTKHFNNSERQPRNTTPAVNRSFLSEPSNHYVEPHCFAEHTLRDNGLYNAMVLLFVLLVYSVFRYHFHGVCMLYIAACHTTSAKLIYRMSSAFMTWGDFQSKLSYKNESDSQRVRSCECMRY
jgi:hypothetical protein